MIAALLVLSLLAIANLAALEFGPLRGQAINVDEVYFAVCAARGITIGEFPIFGCHDNKTPLVYATHQLVQLVAGPYAVGAIKVVAFGTIAVVAALAATVAHRLAGRVAAMAAAAVLLLTISTDASLLALKSEALGTAFVLGALLALMRESGEPRLRDWFICGLGLGVAFQVKQTFAFAGLAVMVMALAGPGASRRRMARVLSMAAGLAVPALLLGATFALQGRLAEYLASTFLYPSIYDAPASASAVRRLAWRVGGVMQDMAHTPAAIVLALLVWPAAWWRSQAAAPPWHWRMRVLSLATVAMLSVAFISPIYFAYHLLPAWILLSASAGVAVARAAAVAGASGAAATWGLAFALAWGAATMAVGSWFSSGKKAELVQRQGRAPFIAGAPGEYGYVLGTWPQFYFEGRLTPASTVLFPWALPGTPKNWAFSPPEPHTIKGRWLAAIQARAVDELMRDFARTPPSYVVIAHDMARKPGSTRITDVLALDAYLSAHCDLAGAAPENLGSSQSLYACNGRRGLSLSGARVTGSSPAPRATTPD